MYEKSKKVIYLEFLRVISILCVMMNHTGTRGFFLFAERQDSKLYFLYMFFSIAIKVAVPLFFMISGALLLKRSESISYTFRHRIIKYIVILIFISAVYHIFYHFINGTPLSFKEYFVTLISYKASMALWYLYSHIAILMMLPLLSILVKNMQEKHFQYMACCYVILVGIIPILRYWLSKGTVPSNPYFEAPLLTTRNVFFFVMGYYFENAFDIKKLSGNKVGIGLLFGAFAIGMTCAITQYSVQITGCCSEAETQTFYNSLIAIPTIATFVAAKYWFENHRTTDVFKKIILFLGGTSFGVFLLEGILRECTQGVFIMMSNYIPTMLACVVWILVAYVIGCVVVALLKLVPGLKRYI